MTILAWAFLAWDCPFWAPKAKVFRPLLCEPVLKSTVQVTDPSTAMKLIEEKKAYDNQFTLLDVQWDGKDRTIVTEKKVRLRAALE